MIDLKKHTPGICSITLKEQTPEEVIGFLVKSGLEAIEWWGGEHVPVGNIDTAAKVGQSTRDAGKVISSYGSYYRMGACSKEGVSFESVLETAHTLGAPTIRVWAGCKNREDCDRSEIDAVLTDAVRIADLAAEKNISITFEFHGGSLTNSNANAVKLSQELKHPNIFFSWQPPHGFTLEHCCEGLKDLLGRLSTVHVYHWTIGSYESNLYSEADQPLKWPDDYNMHPLADGNERWQAYVNIIKGSDQSHPFLLEFVKDGSLEQAKEDAKTLLSLLDG